MDLVVSIAYSFSGICQSSKEDKNDRDSGVSLLWPDVARTDPFQSHLLFSWHRVSHKITEQDKYLWKPVFYPPTQNSWLVVKQDAWDCIYLRSQYLQGYRSINFLGHCCNIWLSLEDNLFLVSRNPYIYVEWLFAKLHNYLPAHFSILSRSLRRAAESSRLSTAYPETHWNGTFCHYLHHS